MDNFFTKARRRQSFLLWLPLVERELSVYQSSVDPYRPKFYGHNPLTGLPVTIVFNEPAPSRTSLMRWNPLLQSWMYSNDAGLTWKRCDFVRMIDKTDCLCDEPKYNE